MHLLTGSTSVSVVVPMFNAIGTIERAIDSIFGQNISSLEIVVVDDASTDGSAELVERKYGEQVRLIRSKRTLGASGARNRGIAASSAEFVAFLDADDEFLPEKLGVQAEILATRGEVSLVSCDAQLIPKHDPPRLMSLGCPPVSGESAWMRLLEYNFIPTPTVMARREQLLQVGGFHSSIVVGEDLDLWLRLAVVGSVEVLPDVLVRIYATDGSLMRSTENGEIRYMLPMLQLHLAKLESRLTTQQRRSILGRRLFDTAYRASFGENAPFLAPYFLRAALLGYRPVRATALALLALARTISGGLLSRRQTSAVIATPASSQRTSI